MSRFPRLVLVYAVISIACLQTEIQRNYPAEHFSNVAYVLPFHCSIWFFVGILHNFLCSLSLPLC